MERSIYNVCVFILIHTNFWRLFNQVLFNQCDLVDFAFQFYAACFYCKRTKQECQISKYIFKIFDSWTYSISSIAREKQIKIHLQYKFGISSFHLECVSHVIQCCAWWHKFVYRASIWIFALASYVLTAYGDSDSFEM